MKYRIYWKEFRQNPRGRNGVNPEGDCWFRDETIDAESDDDAKGKTNNFIQGKMKHNYKISLLRLERIDREEIVSRIDLFLP